MPPVPAHGSHFPEIAHVLKTGRDSNSHPPPYRGGWGVCTGSSCRKEKKKNKIKDFLFLSFFLFSFSLAVFDVLSCETAQCSRNDAVQGYVPAAIETTAVYQCKC